ncbi:leucine-rich repeat and coiled-coil domain-containing protein 1-like [Patiria miniata]|uniref:Leucine-rich repeat and coiled-coil domain-containing protein 1 n=1 Tax=Patiria miniata TaxID=46514 RepID=A0A913ZIH2_PATMI|nr:leucine-rich repeat and coiled-coil domain-containing protein 1-like [Patiria miniata]
MEAVTVRQLPTKNLRVRLTGMTEDQHMNSDPINPHELCMIDAGVRNLSSLRLASSLHTLNLHCNQISTIDGLTGLQHLQHLDLSSNQIARIEGLEALTGLRTLNLSCNKIKVVTGLGSLRSMKRLNLSYNIITDLRGLVALHGSQSSLTHLELQGNQLDSVDHIVECVSGLEHLIELVLAQDAEDNPVCRQPGYRMAMLHSLPRLQVLDGINRQGQRITTDNVLADIPGLDQYLEYLLSSDSTTGNAQEPAVNLVTPRIDQMLDRFRQRAVMSSGTTTTTTTTDTDTRHGVNITMMRQGGRRVGATDHEKRLEQLEKQLADIMTRRPEPRSDVSHGAPTSPRGHRDDETTNRQRSHRSRKPKRDTDQTDESDGDSRGSSMGAAIKQRAKGAKAPNVRQTRASEGRRQKLESQQLIRYTAQTMTESIVIFQLQSVCCWSVERTRPQQQAKSVISTSTGSPPSGSEVRGHPRRAQRVVQTTAEQDADKLALMQELDSERERRWKAEQAAIRLADHIKELQAKTNEERELQDVAILASTRLKQALMNEKESRIRLEGHMEECQAKLDDLTSKLAASQKAEEEQRRALRAMETTSAKMETERLNQHAHEVKKTQEYQMRAAAMGREVDLVKAQCKQQEGKIQQLQELLAGREQEHRQQLNDLYRLDSKELKDVISNEISKEQSRHEQEHRLYKERIDALTRQYSELEDEFRLALQMEAHRFHELQDAFERVSHESSAAKQALGAMTDKEKRSSTIVAELTAMVKEQKGRISELSKSKHETVATSKERIQTLESKLEEARRTQLQYEALRQEKSRLTAQLVAQESVIEGLKAERKLWSQELAQQGSSLAQDRGRLEARIEALMAEADSLRKQSERDNDALKIKTKMLDDQTDTIRKLKEGLVERDGEIKQAREESLSHQRRLEEQLASEQSVNQDTMEEVERLRERKEELKGQVAELGAELEDSRRAYRSLDNKWKEKGDLIGQLETQVRQVKQNFDTKETKLKEERDKAVQAEKAAVERLHRADDAFAKQLEAVKRHHEGERDEMNLERQKEIDAANQRVIEVENEMRLLLSETETQKRVMEDKLKRLTSAFSDLTQGLT